MLFYAGIDASAKAEKYMRRGYNPSGTPYTQYDLDDTKVKGHDDIFLRIDKDVNGYYLSVRQYQKYTHENLSEFPIQKLLLKKNGASYSIY